MVITRKHRLYKVEQFSKVLIDQKRREESDQNSKVLTNNTVQEAKRQNNAIVQLCGKKNLKIIANAW